MKLLYFTPQLSNFGGIERTITDKANYLAKEGHNVTIVTYEQLNRPYAYYLSNGVQHIDLDNSFNLLYRYPIYFRFIKYLLLLHSVKRKLREIRKIYSPSAVVITTPDTDHYLRTVFSVFKGINIAIESHNSFDSHFQVNGLWAKFSSVLQRPRRQYRKANLMIAITSGDAACWRSQGVNNVRVIPNPVTAYDEIVFNQRVKNRIICVGRLSVEKRYDRLIDAFSQVADEYPSWHIDIFGEGSEKARIQTQIREHGLSGRIEIHSPVTDIYSEYKRSQFLVLSSDHEGFGLVLIEAMACGTPVVSCDCPFGPSEIIEDGVTGLLSKMDVSDLAEKIEWMISHPVEREEMGRKAHLAAARYRKEVVMKEWERAYLSVRSL